MTEKILQNVICTKYFMLDCIHRMKWSQKSVIFMLWGNTSYCVKLRVEDLLRYSNKIESVGLRKCPYYHYLTKEVMSE